MSVSNTETNVISIKPEQEKRDFQMAINGFANHLAAIDQSAMPEDQGNSLLAIADAIESNDIFNMWEAVCDYIVDFVEDDDVTQMPEWLHNLYEQVRYVKNTLESAQSRTQSL